MKKHILLLLFTTLVILQSKAHVDLLNPQGGETFMPGDMVIIEWKEVVNHNTLDWDLSYSSDGGETWENLEQNIPVGTYKYEWTVPGKQTMQGRVKIVQDNVGDDYQATSGNFIISSTPVTGISDSREVFDMNIYPNPLIHFSTVEFDNPGHETHTMTLHDTQGRLVKTITNITANQIILERENLQNGLYILQLYADRNVRAIGKLVVN